MKFSLFAHMERVNSATLPTTTYAELYADFIKLCTMADEGGMHAIGPVSTTAWTLRLRRIRLSPSLTLHAVLKMCV